LNMDVSNNIIKEKLSSQTGIKSSKLSLRSSNLIYLFPIILHFMKIKYDETNNHKLT
jgi:hypothetical protein